nr:unnamed protein product [uncultured bacterium]
MKCEWIKESRDLIGVMDSVLLKQLQDSDSEILFTLDDERYLSVYSTLINGISLVFMRSNALQGSRCYRVDDSLAQVLGFNDAQRLRRVLNIRSDRKYLSVRSILRKVNDYALRSMDLEPLPEYVRKRERRRKYQNN